MAPVPGRSGPRASADMCGLLQLLGRALGAAAGPGQVSTRARSADGRGDVAPRSCWCWAGQGAGRPSEEVSVGVDVGGKEEGGAQRPFTAEPRSGRWVREEGPWGVKNRG